MSDSTAAALRLSQAVRSAIRFQLYQSGLTEAGLAGRLKVSEDHLRRLLSGSSPLTLTDLAAIGQALNCEWHVTLVPRVLQSP